MSDIEKLNELLTAWGVQSSYSAHAGVQQVCVGAEHAGDYYNDKSPQVNGYPGFYTCFNFDIDGKFQSMGAWE